MTTVNAASDTLAAAMRNIAPAGPGVCPTCWTFHDPGYGWCVGCNRQPNNLAVAVPITYAPHGGQMYTALHGYKNEPRSDTQRYHAIRLAAVLWRFLETHEACVARAAGVDHFDLVTVVPSKVRTRDEERGWLRIIAGEWCGATVGRFERVLRPGDDPQVARAYQPGRFTPTRRLDGARVLLIDDTWVTGTSIQTAAADLRSAGAQVVAGVVIARYLRRDFGGDWGNVGDLYDALPRTFNWSLCAVN